MTPEELQSQVAQNWQADSADVMARPDVDLLEIAPGKDVLDILFMEFMGRHYKPEKDGIAIAKAMSPPDEIVRLVHDFLSDASTETNAIDEN